MKRSVTRQEELFRGQHKDIVSIYELNFKQGLQLLSPETNIELQLH